MSTFKCRANDIFSKIKLLKPIPRPANRYDDIAVFRKIVPNGNL